MPEGRVHLETTIARNAATIATMDVKAVEVICHSGYVADEEPRAIVVDGRRLEVVAIERRWLEPEARCFMVRLGDGARCVLRQEVTASAWTIVRAKRPQ